MRKEIAVKIQRLQQIKTLDLKKTQKKAKRPIERGSNICCYHNVWKTRFCSVYVCRVYVTNAIVGNCKMRREIAVKIQRLQQIKTLYLKKTKKRSKETHRERKQHLLLSQCLEN